MLTEIPFPTPVPPLDYFLRNLSLLEVEIDKLKAEIAELKDHISGVKDSDSVTPTTNPTNPLIDDTLQVPQSQEADNAPPAAGNALQSAKGRAKK
jgi:hypothetical protein